MIEPVIGMRILFRFKEREEEGHHAIGIPTPFGTMISVQSGPPKGIHEAVVKGISETRGYIQLDEVWLSLKEIDILDVVDREVKLELEDVEEEEP